jgi:Putative transposase
MSYFSTPLLVSASTCAARSRLWNTAGVSDIAGGFSLHAGVDIAPHQRQKLERLCRYVSRPPRACERLALSASGDVRYTLKTPYRDGTTHIVLEPLDLMARLAALVPLPRMHLTRYHGVFAPRSLLRAAVTPAHRGMGAKLPPADAAKPPTPRHVAMNWVRRLKRVFGIEIDRGARWGGKLQIVASIEQPEVIAKLLSHLERTAPQPCPIELPKDRKFLRARVALCGRFVPNWGR